ncbi:hypothetical protein Hdeb2414_s0006g00218201 [Helianthus debilis subsp. tardiflorus]
MLEKTPPQRRCCGGGCRVAADDEERECEGERGQRRRTPFPATILRRRQRWRFWFQQASDRAQVMFGSELVQIRDVFGLDSSYVWETDL